MILSEQDREVFFSLFLPLLDYVNRRTGAEESLRSIMQSGRNVIVKLRIIAQKLWKDVSYIDDYLALPENEEMPQELREIVFGWKRHIDGDFIFERQLAHGAIFIDSKTQEVYLVKGITDSWRDMIPNLEPPISLEATLIPFKDVIISDGLVMVRGVSFGRHYIDSFREIYRFAKQNGTIKKAFSC